LPALPPSRASVHRSVAYEYIRPVHWRPRLEWDPPPGRPVVWRARPLECPSVNHLRPHQRLRWRPPGQAPEPLLVSSQQQHCVLSCWGSSRPVWMGTAVRASLRASSSGGGGACLPRSYRRGVTEEARQPRQPERHQRPRDRLPSQDASQPLCWRWRRRTSRWRRASPSASRSWLG